MAPDPRRQAQARADQIRAFRRELADLAAAGVVHLTPEQQAGIAAHHEELLERLAGEFDVDRSERQGQLSRGLRLASLLGAAALVAAITALVERTWGQLTLPAQVTLLTAFPLAALAGVHLAAERERTRYIAGLFALVACGTAWFAIAMIARLLDLPPSALLLWPATAFGIAVALSYGFRLVFALSLAIFVVAVASVFFVAGGVPWTTLFERLEPVTGAALVLRLTAHHLRPLGVGFAATARSTGLALALAGLFLLANIPGLSLLAYQANTARVIYQVLFVPVTVILLWRGLRRSDTTEVNIAAAALALFILVRYIDWFWDLVPAWAFFFALAGVAFAGIALMRRARRRLETAWPV